MGDFLRRHGDDDLTVVPLGRLCVVEAGIRLENDLPVGVL